MNKNLIKDILWKLLIILLLIVGGFFLGIGIYNYPHLFNVAAILFIILVLKWKNKK